MNNENLSDIWLHLLNHKKLIIDMIELNDPYNAHHNNNSAYIALLLAKRMGLSSTQCKIIKLAANLHDIGKQSIPKTILSKPTRLSKEEYQLVQTHVTVGAELLSDVGFPEEVVRGVGEHHERIDGSGYPKGLTQDEISIEGQVVGLTDVVSSLISKRTYRDTLSKNTVVSILQGEKHKFDKEMMRMAVEIVMENDLADGHLH
ncbi:MAG: HD domain-containing protein [Emcibacter sp.]|nr:HD domain-containing protein [Emcibacter sp.]